MTGLDQIIQSGAKAARITSTWNAVRRPSVPSSEMPRSGWPSAVLQTVWTMLPRSNRPARNPLYLAHARPPNTRAQSTVPAYTTTVVADTEDTDASARERFARWATTAAGRASVPITASVRRRVVVLAKAPLGHEARHQLAEEAHEDELHADDYEENAESEQRTLPNPRAAEPQDGQVRADDEACERHQHPDPAEQMERPVP